MYNKNEILRKKAVALKYQQGADSAPRVVAGGRGVIAEQIIEKAKQFDVPFFENEALANSLLDVDIGETIPPQLYKAVAEVFLWLLTSEKDAQIEKEREEAQKNR